MEALYLDKPIITLNGGNLRANHTVTMLKQMDLDILVANDYKEYISLANKIMKNEEFLNL